MDDRASRLHRSGPVVRGSTDLAIRLVIETASGVLTGRFGPREAVTILASQAPQARAEARHLAERDPARSGAYAELLRSIAAELASHVDSSTQARDLSAVVEDLERVAEALDVG